MKPPRTHPICLVLLCLIALFSPAAVKAGVAEIVPGEVLVGLRADRDTPANVASLSAAVGQVVSRNGVLHVARIKLRGSLTVEQAIARLRQRGDILYAEANHVYHISAAPNDTYYASEWALPRIQADLAWPLWRPQAQVVVAVVDTGIDYTHPDLAGKILRDPAGNVVGYNAVGTNAHSGISTDPIDDHGHGTHVAGTIGAQVNNGIGVAGIAGWDANAGSTDTSTRLMPVKVLDSNGGGSDVTVANGITWAADHGARAINLSLGGNTSTSTLQNAVNYALGKGVVVAAAAGNAGVSAPSYPAAYAGVISVAATDYNDTLTSWSNWGSWVSTAAPGLSVFSTLPTYPAGGNLGTNYGYLSGTSMACPHVVGEVALLLGQNPSLTGAQAADLVIRSVDTYTPYGSHSIGSGTGRINVYKALQGAGSGGGATGPPSAPTGLAATGGDTQVSLNWSPSAGAVSYSLYRGTASGAESLLAKGITGASYMDAGLANGTTYYYWVTAVNSAGESPASNEASATPLAPGGTPTAPTNLKASGSKKGVQLGWTQSSSPGIVYNAIYRSSTQAGSFSLLATIGAGTSFADRTAAKGVVYDYVVTAIDAGGAESPASNVASGSKK